MGELALDNVELTRKYGVLGVRFNTLREFYRCVRIQINNHQTAEGCVNGVDR